MNNKLKTYSELCTLKSYDDRLNYLKLSGTVGGETFGFDRYLNQQFYKSKEWKKVRDEVIIRDNACDMGIRDMNINGKVYVHHMNPLSVKDLDDREQLLNPEYLICVSHETHNAIHYGIDANRPKKEFVERKPNDTCPWIK